MGPGQGHQHGTLHDNGALHDNGTLHDNGAFEKNKLLTIAPHSAALYGTHFRCRYGQVLGFKRPALGFTVVLGINGQRLEGAGLDPRHGQRNGALHDNGNAAGCTGMVTSLGPNRNRHLTMRFWPQTGQLRAPDAMKIWPKTDSSRVPGAMGIWSHGDPVRLPDAMNIGRAAPRTCTRTWSPCRWAPRPLAGQLPQTPQGSRASSPNPSLHSDSGPVRV